MSETPQSSIEVSDLVHRYRRKGPPAVDGLSFRVEPGQVYGLLGLNGAGKSTTIQTLLGLLKPTAGTVRVLGLNPWWRGVQVRRRVGYVPEDPRACDWMTVREVLWFVSQFHATWDPALQDDMVRRLELPLEQKLRELSRGTLAKVALVSATAFRPEALVLDDPTSGLDPVVRREFLEHVIEVAAEGGRAVLFASHVLDEVERLADRIGIVVGGRMVLDRALDALKRDVRRLDATFEDAAPDVLLASALSVRRDGRTLSAVIDGDIETAVAKLRKVGASDVATSDLSLEDIFVEVVHATRRRSATAAA